MVSNVPTADAHGASNPPLSATMCSEITFVHRFSAKEIVSAPRFERENEWEVPLRTLGHLWVDMLLEVPRFKEPFSAKEIVRRCARPRHS